MIDKTRHQTSALLCLTSAELNVTQTRDVQDRLGKASGGAGVVLHECYECH